MNINLKLDKKKIIIIASAALVISLIIVSLIIYKNNQNKNKDGINLEEKVFTPEFLSTEEKTKLEIPVETKIQALSRDKDGEIKVYRIIKSDSDIVDPSTINPISPQSK